MSADEGERRGVRGPTVRVTVNPGQEVIATITEAVEAAGVVDASMTLIGAVDVATISTMAAADARQDTP